MSFLSALFPLALTAIGSSFGMPELGALAGAGGGLLGGLFGGGNAAAASLPAATALPGIANASPSLLSAVGLPATPGASGMVSPATAGFDFQKFLRTGGNVMGLLNQAKQLSAPTPLPSLPQQQAPALAAPAAPEAPAAAPATAPMTAPVGSAAMTDPYTSSLQKLMKQHGSGSYGF